MHGLTTCPLLVRGIVRISNVTKINLKELVQKKN